MLRQLFARWAGADRAAPSKSDAPRERALDKLREHGIDAHLYLANAGCEDQELADALQLLARWGYIMTDTKGALVGKVVKARPTADERARGRRKRFFIVKQG
jgi:hypothetical protein